MGNVSSELSNVPNFISYETIQNINDKSILINTLAEDEPQPLVAVIAIENIFSWPAKL